MYQLRESMLFGKYMGKSPAQIVLQDPNWVFRWAEEGKPRNSIEQWLHKVATRARAIRLRPLDGVEQVVNYTFDRSVGRLVAVDIFPCAEPVPQECSRAVDLSYSHGFNPQDTLGGQLLARTVKIHLFGQGVRITRKLADDFFENDANFVIGE